MCLCQALPAVLCRPADTRVAGVVEGGEELAGFLQVRRAGAGAWAASQARRLDA